MRIDPSGNIETVPAAYSNCLLFGRIRSCVRHGINLTTILAICAGLCGNRAHAAALSVQHDIAYGSDPRQVMDIYVPDSKPVKGTIIFFYGGYWRGGHKAEYHFVGETMAGRGFLTIIPDYRLYPQVLYPAFFQDAASTVRWSHDHSVDYGGSPLPLYLMGYSSGAYMAATLAVDPGYLGQTGLAPSAISGVVGIAGFYNLMPAARPELAPIFANVHDPEKLDTLSFVNSHNPRMLLLTGRKDDEIDLNDATALDSRIEQSGGKARMIVYDDLGHIGLMLPFSPLFHSHSSVVDDIVNFMTESPQ